MWLQELGYNTYYVGKFLVDYSVNNFNQTPKGFTDIDALVVPWTVSTIIYLPVLHMWLTADGSVDVVHLLWHTQLLLRCSRLPPQG